MKAPSLFKLYLFYIFVFLYSCDLELIFSGFSFSESCWTIASFRNDMLKCCCTPFIWIRSTFRWYCAAPDVPRLPAVWARSVSIGPAHFRRSVAPILVTPDISSFCIRSQVEALTNTGRSRPTPLEEVMELYQIGRFLELEIVTQGCEDLILEWLTIETLPAVLRYL